MPKPINQILYNTTLNSIRCLFSLCVLMFSTDDQCSIPFHTLTADTIESCGGSTQLLKILNRIGVCSSADTLARSIKCRVKEREKSGPEEECWRHAPTIISTDNIDFQHSYACVFCGKQTSSWHGTTVQAVQSRLNNRDSQNPMATCRSELQCITAQRSATHGECTVAASMKDIQTCSRHSECTVSERSVEHVTRKRSLSTQSPCKPLRSPIPKLKRRAHTGTEGNPKVLSPPHPVFTFQLLVGIQEITLPLTCR